MNVASLYSHHPSHISHYHAYSLDLQVQRRFRATAPSLKLSSRIVLAELNLIARFFVCVVDTRSGVGRDLVETVHYLRIYHRVAIG